MNGMRKDRRFLTTAVFAMVMALLGGVWLIAGDVIAQEGDTSRVASLIQEMEGIDASRLDALRPLAVRQYEIPKDSVDVMRARITETYVVDGVGEDTVELTGWIAVKHFDARPAEGATELNWLTAVVDTQFVGMELKGNSKIFGPVEVSLDETRAYTGQVGRIEMPEYAETALLAALDKPGSPGTKDGTTYTSDDCDPRDPYCDNQPQPTCDPKDPNCACDTRDPDCNSCDPRTNPDCSPCAVGDAQCDQTSFSWWWPGSCVAAVAANIEMPDLDLKMKTAGPVHWYSLVDTIPPVGHTASIAVEPVRLTANGREVGTLKGGKVHFREVVRQVYLSDNASDRFADSK